MILGLGFAGLFAASVVSAFLFRAARRGGRGRTAKAVALGAPFLGLLWMAVAFYIHVQVSHSLAHQDCGLSGDPYVTLPSGYVIGSHNTYDGYFKAPGVDTDVPIAGPGYVRSIVHLQYSEPYFTGTQFDFNNSKIRTFVFDTRTWAFSASAPAAAPRQFDSSDKTRMDAWTDANTHAQMDAESYWGLYRRYRRHRPNYVFFALIAVGEGTIYLLGRKAWRAAPVVTSA